MTEAVMAPPAPPSASADSVPATPPASAAPPVAAPAEAKPVSDKAAEPRKAEAPKPVVYDLKLPEGIKADPSYIESRKAFASKYNLAPEAAQGLIDAELAHKAAVRAEWQSAIKNDPAFAGPKLDTAIQEVRAAMATILGEDAGVLMDAFNDSGLSDFPPLFRALHRFAQRTKESSHAETGAPTGSKSNPLFALYGEKSPQLFKAST